MSAIAIDVIEALTTKRNALEVCLWQLALSLRPGEVAELGNDDEAETMMRELLALPGRRASA